MRNLWPACIVLPGFALACTAPVDDAPPPPDSPPLPEPICKAPAAPTAWFTEATADFGLGPTGLDAAGTCLVSPDLDGDGWSDLLSFTGNSSRGLVNDEPTRYVLMNRPAAEDETRRVLVGVADLAGLGATREGGADRGASIALFGDLDNDGDADVITCPSDFTDMARLQWDPCAAFLNDGEGGLTLAPASAIDGVYPAPSAVLLDYDRDGILDVWFAGIAHWPYGGALHQPPRLLRGNGDGTFADVSAAVGLPLDDAPHDLANRFRPTLGVTACDLDDDGDSDVIGASYGREPNQAWRNDAGVYVDVSRALALDYDDRQDFSDDESYRCYCESTQSCTPMPPAPVVNCNAFGGPYLRGWLPGLSDQPFGLGGNSMGVTCADADDDGDMDVVFANITHGDVGSSSDPTELLVNPGDGGPFERPGNEVTGLYRDLPLGGNHYDHVAAFVDLDLDGRKELLVENNHPGPDLRHWLWTRGADGLYREVAQASGLWLPDDETLDVGAAFVDLDGDGDLDVAAPSSAGQSLRVFRNDAGAAANSLRIRLIGKGAGFSNVSAIGARVRVTAGGRTQTLEVGGGQGLSNIQTDFLLHFGLGESCEVDGVEVRWPDAAGTVATYGPVRANYTVVIREGESAVEHLP
jgi:enediyne biosynthesis protein E4